jgi:hypothetical protein
MSLSIWQSLLFCQKYLQVLHLRNEQILGNFSTQVTNYKILIFTATRFGIPYASLRLGIYDFSDTPNPPFV